MLFLQEGGGPSDAAVHFLGLHHPLKGVEPILDPLNVLHQQQFLPLFLRQFLSNLGGKIVLEWLMAFLWVKLVGIFSVNLDLCSLLLFGFRIIQEGIVCFFPERYA